MTTFFLLLTCAFFGTSVSIPQADYRAYALNPAEINTLYSDPDSLNPLKDVPPSPIIKPNVEDTVQEVEALIRANPKLPRLTRGEIIDIIENITSSEHKKTREDGKRALMVVMPFTAGSAQGDDIRELYTRKPVTRIIGEVEHHEEKKKKPKKPPRKWPLFPEINLENEVLTENKNNAAKNENKLANIPKFQYLPNHKPSTTTTTTTTEKITTKVPFVVDNSVTTYKPKYTGTWPTPQPVKIVEHTTLLSPVYTTTTPKPRPTRKNKPVKYSNHKYPGDEGIVTPPVFKPVDALTPHATSLKKPQTNFEEVKISATGNIPMVDEDYSAPSLKKHQPQMSMQKPQVSVEQVKIVPPVLKPMVGDVYSAPHTIHKPHLQPQATIEEVKLTPDMYGDMPKLKKPQEMVSTTTTEHTILDDIAIPDHYKGVIKGLDLIIANENKTPQIKQVIKQRNPQKVHITTTSSTIMPDISNVADNLSPDMKELLMSFGLINKPTTRRPAVTTQAIRYVQKAEVNPNSYASFKPLPNNAPTHNDMDEFLSRFGLGRNSFRSQKAINMDKPKKVATKTSELDFDAIPDHLKNVVNDLGFTTKNIKDVSKEKHTFNPSDKSTATEAELNKLEKLLGVIKDLDKMNGNITEESLKDFDSDTFKNLIKSLNNNNNNSFVPLNEQDAPNPIDHDENLSKTGGAKREETTVSSEEATTVVYASSEGSNEVSLEDLEASSDGISAMTTVKPMESTEESKSGYLGDLESSFGAMVEAPAVTEEPTTTTTIRTGFYYLLDWNTFWEMDNQNGRRLNLRFQPHAGNPRYFQSVTVP